MLERIALVACAVANITMGSTAACAQAVDTLQHADTVLHVEGLKDPQLAEALGAVPGGGLVYAGAWVGGIGTFVATPVLIGAGALVIDSHGCPVLDFSCRPHSSASDHIIGSAFIALGVGLWAYEAGNAGRIVRRANAKKIEAATRRITRFNVRPFVAPGFAGSSLSLGVNAVW